MAADVNYYETTGQSMTNGSWVSRSQEFPDVGAHVAPTQAVELLEVLHVS